MSASRNLDNLIREVEKMRGKTFPPGKFLRFFKERSPVAKARAARLILESPNQIVQKRIDGEHSMSDSPRIPVEWQTPKVESSKSAVKPSHHSQVYIYDFTFFGPKQGELPAVGDFVELIQPLFKKWVFQLERCPTNSRLHYQGRGSLFKVRRGVGGRSWVG